MNPSSASRLRRPEHSEIKHKNMRFLITDRPTDTNVERYIEVKIQSFVCLYLKLFHDFVVNYFVD